MWWLGENLDLQTMPVIFSRLFIFLSDSLFFASGWVHFHRAPQQPGTAGHAVMAGSLWNDAAVWSRSLRDQHHVPAAGAMFHWRCVQVAHGHAPFLCTHKKYVFFYLELWISLDSLRGLRPDRRVCGHILTYPNPERAARLWFLVRDVTCHRMLRCHLSFRWMATFSASVAGGISRGIKP